MRNAKTIGSLICLLAGLCLTNKGATTLGMRHNTNTWEIVFDPSVDAQVQLDYVSARPPGSEDPDWARLLLSETVLETSLVTPPPPPPPPVPEVPPTTPVVIDFGIAMNTPPSTPLTLANLAASTYGPMSWETYQNPNFWTTPGPSITNSLQLRTGGLPFYAPGNAIAVNHANTSDQAFIGRYTPVNRVSVSFFMKSGLPHSEAQNWALYDLVYLVANNGQDFLVLQWRRGALRAHGKRNPTKGVDIPVPNNVWLYVSMLYQRNGTGIVQVRNTETGALLGESTVPIGDSATGIFRFGYGNHGVPWNGLTEYSQFLIDTTAAPVFPLGL
jgi:hypothetical protein